MKVSVLIVNWNGLHLLEPCFEALKNQTVAPHEVIVVDNGSRDGSPSFLEKQEWSILKTLFLDENRGFSGGNNAGFPLVTGDVVALLNNDTVVDPEWIAQAVPLFQDPSVGMVACKTLRLEDPGVIDKAGHLIYPDGLNRGRGSGCPDGPEFQKQTEVLWPDGGAGFYRKSMLDETGYFDDRFFLYGEDAELGMRGRWAGYRCIYQPKSKLLHHQSATLGKGSSKKIYYIERNRIWVLIKTFPISYIFLSPVHSLLRYFMNVISLLSNRGAAAGFRQRSSGLALAGALIKALFHGLLGIPIMWSRRKKVLRRISAGEMKRLLRTHRISVSEITLQD